MLDKNVCKNNSYFQLLVIVMIIKKNDTIEFH